MDIMMLADTLRFIVLVALLYNLVMIADWAGRVGEAHAQAKEYRDKEDKVWLLNWERGWWDSIRVRWWFLILCGRNRRR